MDIVFLVVVVYGLRCKELSDEEKKQIYKASRNELVKTLNTRFNTEKTKAIMAAVKELRDKEK
mgnify:CR=1 FL=1